MILAINTIAKAVGAEFPNVLFHTLAYDYTEQPPKRTKPLPSVVVQVDFRTRITTCYAYGVEKAFFLPG